MIPISKPLNLYWVCRWASNPRGVFVVAANREAAIECHRMPGDEAAIWADKVTDLTHKRGMDEGRSFSIHSRPGTNHEVRGTYASSETINGSGIEQCYERRDVHDGPEGVKVLVGRWKKGLTGVRRPDFEFVEETPEFGDADRVPDAARWPALRTSLRIPEGMPDPFPPFPDSSPP